jgi:general secretion pathway protein D
LGPTTQINGTAVPSTTKRSANATVSVRDRDTVILGGFISSTKSISKSGVPYLQDLPGLGALFRSKTDSLDKTELIVLIRPTVLPTPEAAAQVAKDERDRMPLVKSAMRDYRVDENKRLKEADKIAIPDERAN